WRRPADTKCRWGQNWARLGTAGLAVAVVNPRQVRDFAKASERLAKTDRRAAQVLAPFAEALHPVARPLPEAPGQEVAALALAASAGSGAANRGAESAGSPPDPTGPCP